jgi:hypothetical protein
MSTKELPTITSDGIARIRTYLLSQVKKTPVGVKVKHSEEDTNSYSKSSDEYTTADGKISIYLKQNEKAYEFNVKIAVKNKVATIKDGTYAIEQNDESDIDDLFNDVLEAVNELMHKKIEAAHKAAEKAKKKAEAEKKKAEAAKKKAEAAKKKAEAAKKKGPHIPFGAEQALATAAVLNPSVGGKKSKPAKKR